MQTDTAVDAPTELTKAAKSFFRTRVVEPTPSLIQRIAAVLTVDLAPGRAAFGERSAAGAQARQMLFDAGDNAVDLRVTKTEKGFDLRGQILGEGFDKGSVEIAGFTAKIENGGFTLAGLPAGEHTFVARGTDKEINIEKITLS
jgi:hypothetical protein